MENPRYSEAMFRRDREDGGICEMSVNYVGLRIDREATQKGVFQRREFGS